MSSADDDLDQVDLGRDVGRHGVLQPGHDDADAWEKQRKHKEPQGPIVWTGNVREKFMRAASLVCGAGDRC